MINWLIHRNPKRLSILGPAAFLVDTDMTHIMRYSDDSQGTTFDEREMAAELKAVREIVLPNGEITVESIELAEATIEEFGLDLENYKLALAKVLDED